MLAILRIVFRLLTLVSPSAASRLAVEMFRRPRRFAAPSRERDLMKDAKAFEVRLGASARIRAWKWGEGPIVVLAHGWEGRGSQMASLAEPLVAAGFQVITFDGPGHGQSSGKRSSLPHFAWALRGLIEKSGPPRAIVGHSFGCAATTLALRDGMELPRAVFIAPPIEPADYTRQFGVMFNLPQSVVDGLRTRIEERFLRPWSDYSLAMAAPRMKVPLLIIHDREDNETPYDGGKKLAELWPGARLITTEGLGHRRILRDDEVISAVVDFVRGA